MPPDDRELDKKTYPMPDSVECPFCRGTDTRVESPFGGFLSVAHYYCRRCRTVFDWIKREAGDEPNAG